MIVQWFSDMFYKIMTGLLSWVNLPEFPSDVVESISGYMTMILQNGFSIYEFFVPSMVTHICIPILIGLSLFEYGYYIVMWVLKKIPAVGIH